jgi:cysteine desulfurase
MPLLKKTTSCDPRTCDCYGTDFLRADPAKIARRIYVDHNATTPLDPAVLEAMAPYLCETFGNPSSVHAFGRDARAALDEARARLAGLLGCEEGEIIFTSGGTESDNTAIFGVARASRQRGRHIITSQIEHHAVLHACRYLEERGECEVTYLPAGRDGRVDPAELRRALRPDTVLVSIMSANNETGTRQLVSELAGICRERGVPFHTDAVQCFGKEPVSVQAWPVDLLSLSAHKFGGPKAAGALYCRRGTPLDALLHGGSHENERRAGTENVAGIVGLAFAAEAAARKCADEAARLQALTDEFVALVQQKIRGVTLNGHPAHRLANTVNLSFAQCDSAGLLAGLDLEGVAVSTGAACAVGSLQPSHVLQAMGLPDDQARSAIRFSFGSANTAADLPLIVIALQRVVARLRLFTPR